MENDRRKKRRTLEARDNQAGIGEAPLESRSQLVIPSGKITLQLFPLDDVTQHGLQKEGYNPHLELTLSFRKKISSVVKHLSSKWSGSTIAKGELMLFPYYVKLEEVDSCRRWTSNDMVITAWEVYVEVGSASVFRLRYGWRSNILPEACGAAPNMQYACEVRRTGCSKLIEMPEHQDKKDATVNHINSEEAGVSSADNMVASGMAALLVGDDLKRNGEDLLSSCAPWDDCLNNLSIGGLLSDVSLLRRINGPDSSTISFPSDSFVTGNICDLLAVSKDASKAKKIGCVENEPPQPIFLVPSDISVGGLLSEASLLCANKAVEDSNRNLQTDGLLSDPLDSLLGTHPEMPKPPLPETTASILDAEATCHAFPKKFHQGSGIAASGQL